MSGKHCGRVRDCSGALFSLAFSAKLKKRERKARRIAFFFLARNAAIKKTMCGTPKLLLFKKNVSILAFQNHSI